MTPEHPATTLLIIRHAQAREPGSSSYGNETPLSLLGRQQATALATALAEEGPPVAVYASPLRRALETATIVCERLGLKLRIDRRLAEFQLGQTSIQTVKQRPDLLVWQPDHKGADGETLSEFSARVAAFCDDVVECHLGERIAVVSHAGTIDATFRWSLAIPTASPWQYEFNVANASISEIEFWPCGQTQGGARRYTAIQRLGDIRHLAGLVTEF